MTMEFIEDTILGSPVFIDQCGYINVRSISDKCAKRFSNWKSNQHSQRFLKVVSKHLSIDEDELWYTQHTGIYRGIFLHYIVAISYAEWCSPKFHIAVIELVHKYNQGNLEVINGLMNNHNNNHNTNSVVDIYKQDRMGSEIKNDIYIQEWLDKDVEILGKKDEYIEKLETMVVDKDKEIGNMDTLIRNLRLTNTDLETEIYNIREENEKMQIDSDGRSVIENIDYLIDIIQDIGVVEGSSGILSKIKELKTQIGDLKVSVNKHIARMIEEKNKASIMYNKCLELAEDNYDESLVNKFKKLSTYKQKPVDNTVDIVTSKYSICKKKELLKSSCGLDQGDVIYYIYSENVSEFKYIYSISCQPPSKERDIVHTGLCKNKKVYGLLLRDLGLKFNIYNIPNASIYHNTPLQTIIDFIDEWIEANKNI